MGEPRGANLPFNIELTVGANWPVSFNSVGGNNVYEPAAPQAKLIHFALHLHQSTCDTHIGRE